MVKELRATDSRNSICVALLPLPVFSINHAMNVESFITPNFDPVAYLDQLLPPSNPDSYYSTATALLPSLELLARNTRVDLNSALSALLRTSTRLGMDMDTLLQDTKLLTAQIPQVKADVAGLQLSNGVMSELSFLEVVQERMHQVTNAFNKARQWTEQVDEQVRLHIDSGNYDMVEQRITELHELLPIWEGTVELQSRQERILNLEKALMNARTKAAVTASMVPRSATPDVGTQKTRPRTQSRLRVDSSDAY
jgi:hypothetical protein